MGFIEMIMPVKERADLNSAGVHSLETKYVGIEDIQRVVKKWEKDGCLYFKTEIVGEDSEIGLFLANIENIDKELNQVIETIIIHRNRILELEDKDIRIKNSLFLAGKKTYLTIASDIWRKDEEYKKKAKAELEKTIELFDSFIESGALILKKPKKS